MPTHIIGQPTEPQDDRLGGISLRGALAFILAYTLCLLAVWQYEIPQELAGAVHLALGFFFGQKLNTNGAAK